MSKRSRADSGGKGGGRRVRRRDRDASLLESLLPELRTNELYPKIDFVSLVQLGRTCRLFAKELLCPQTGPAWLPPNWRQRERRGIIAAFADVFLRPVRFFTHFETSAYRTLRTLEFSPWKNPAANVLPLGVVACVRGPRLWLRLEIPLKTDLSLGDGPFEVRPEDYSSSALAFPSLEQVRSFASEADAIQLLSGGPDAKRAGVNEVLLEQKHAAVLRCKALGTERRVLLRMKNAAVFLTRFGRVLSTARHLSNRENQLLSRLRIAKARVVLAETAIARELAALRAAKGQPPGEVLSAYLDL
jgi:hypothetical protein